MSDRTPTCDAFDELLPDYLEGTLGREARLDVDAHLGGCLRCTALVRDLEDITRSASTDAAKAPTP